MLQPSKFTDFMGSYHNQDQYVIQLVGFSPPDDFMVYIREKIFISARNKTTVLYRIPNEMFKTAPELFTELLLKWWLLVGRSKTYPVQWKIGMFTPLYKKGDTSLPINYRPFCMLSHARKIIEAALANIVMKSFKLFSRQFGFQKYISSTMTLIDV